MKRTSVAIIVIVSVLFFVSLYSNYYWTFFKTTASLPTLPISREATVVAKQEATTKYNRNSSSSESKTRIISSERRSDESEASIQWPQTDLTIRSAIRLGEVIQPSFVLTEAATPWNATAIHEERMNQTTTGYTYEWQGQQYEAPIPGLATVVSAFYDLSSSSSTSSSWWSGINNSNNNNNIRSGKHDVEEYKTWLQNFLSMTDPLIFFCKPNSVWEDTVRTHRQHAPTIIATVPFEELPTVKSFTHSFWQSFGIQRDPQQGLRYVRAKDTRLYQIWNAKAIFLEESAIVNPFDTEHFVWLDAGYFRDELVSGVIVRNNMTENGLSLNQKQMIFQNVFPKEQGYLIAAGAFGGSTAAVHQFYKNYWKTFWYMVTKHHYSSIGMEQYVLVHLCKSFPEQCLIQESEHWFRLGQEWLRDPSYNFVRYAIALDPTSPARLPGSQNPRLIDLPLVHGAVDLPQEFPIH